MIKKFLIKIFVIFFIYIIFVFLASDLALKMDKKLWININKKILEIKDKIIFVFSSEENFKKSLENTANSIDKKTEKISEKLDNPTPNTKNKILKQKKLEEDLRKELKR